MTVTPRQSILDVALSQTGALESYIDILIDNDQLSLSLNTSDIQILDSRISNRKVVAFFQINGTPTTAPDQYFNPIVISHRSFSRSFSKSFS